MTKTEIEDLAEGFVLEYLDRLPEFIDVAEYVDENLSEEEDLNDEMLKAVYDSVIDQIRAARNQIGEERVP